jgi:hypothetical protein
MGRLAALLAGASLVVVPARAFAQLDEDSVEEAPKPKKKPAKTVTDQEEGAEPGTPAEPDEEPKPKKKPKPVPVAPAAVAAAPGDATDEAAQPTLSVAIERLAGFAYVAAGQADTETTASVTVFNVGGIALNPYGATRVGVDFAIGTSGVWLGGAFGFSTSSASTSGNGKSEDIGSLTIYSLSPRVGYRIPLSPRFDITPRAGFTLAGGSVGTGGNSSFGVFSVALSAEGLATLRATNQINLLGGLAIDRTVSASVSESSGSGSSSSTDIKGALLNIQLWLGVGAYL